MLRDGCFAHHLLPQKVHPGKPSSIANSPVEKKRVVDAVAQPFLTGIDSIDVLAGFLRQERFSQSQNLAASPACTLRP
jgi:hypothetical protein